MSVTPLIYDPIAVFAQVVVSLFFREVRTRGAHNIPREGPIIMVAGPHSNQFIDGLLLICAALQEARRQVSFIVAKKSVDMKFVGPLFKLANSIPVRRAGDEAKAGRGRIFVTKEDPTLLHGIDTTFTKDIHPRMQIQLPKSVGAPLATVAEVLSDTSVRLKGPFSKEESSLDFLSLIDEHKEKGLEYKVLPVIDQNEMYEHVYAKLNNGGCIGIFPEGGSHDRTDFLPFKAGACIMALGAMAANPGLDVQIVPVGLSYFHPNRFRSRAVIEFGKPIRISQEQVEEFKKGGANKREVSGSLLDTVVDAVKMVTLRSPDYETLMVMQAARRLYEYQPFDRPLNLGEVVELNKRFMAGYLQFQDEPKIQDLRKKVLSYNKKLFELGLRDHQVAHAKMSWRRCLGLLAARFVKLGVWSIFVLPGLILNGPIFLLTSRLSKKKAREALAASTVKVQGKDVIASWKVIIALGATPILYTIYAIIATVVAHKAGLSRGWQIATPFLTWGALPLIGYCALKFGEAGIDIVKSLRPLIVSLFPGQQKELKKLKQMREELQKELANVIQEFGPKMHEGFESWRILPNRVLEADGDSRKTE